MAEITINVKVAELIAVLQKNKAKHLEAYALAVIEYREKAKEALLKKLEDFSDDSKIYKLDFNDLPRPRQFSKTYDDMIGMLEFHTGEELPLTASQYKNYIQDEWNWSSSFDSTNAPYKLGVACGGCGDSLSGLRSGLDSENLVLTSASWEEVD